MVPACAGAKSALLSNFPSVVSVNLRARPSKVLEADCILEFFAATINVSHCTAYSGEAVDHTHVPSPCKRLYYSDINVFEGTEYNVNRPISMYSHCDGCNQGQGSSCSSMVQMLQVALGSSVIDLQLAFVTARCVYDQKFNYVIIYFEAPHTLSSS
jgi:hypothetical protein